MLKPIQIQNESNQIVEDGVATPGFMRSLSGPEKNGLGLNIEVVLSKANAIECDKILGHGSSEVSKSEDQTLKNSSDQHCGGTAAYAKVAEVNTYVQTSKSTVVAQKRKTSKQEKAKGPAKFQGKRKGISQIGVGSSLNFKKGAIFRSAAAALSLSLASKFGSGQLLLNEAEASLQIGQILGMNCKGNEEEVISKLMELEAKDKEVLGQRGNKAA